MLVRLSLFPVSCPFDNLRVSLAIIFAQVGQRADLAARQPRYADFQAEPDEVGAEAGGDPRAELIRQLLEYKKFKDAAALLEEQAERQMERMARLPLEIPPPPDLAQQPLQRVELWDLVSAFGRLMRETAALAPKQIVMDETPIHLHMERILGLIQERGRVPFSDVFTPPQTRGRLLGLFLAILELIKSRRIWAEQPELFGPIWLVPAPAAVNGQSP